MGASARERISLEAPPTDVATLAIGPSIGGTESLVRCTRSVFDSPWYFSADGSGRFDLEDPEGTCYLASDIVGALRETLGPDYMRGNLVAESFFINRTLWELLPRSTGLTDHIANLLDDGWNFIGLTNEIFDISSYILPRAWADCFRRAGWEGIRVRLRHLLSSERYGVALFGPAGAQPRDSRFYDPIRASITRPTLDTFTSATGIGVDSTPVPLDRLHILS